MKGRTHDEVAAWLDVLGCPCCQGPLRRGAEDLVCARSGHSFPILEGIPSLVGEADRDRLAAFSRRYRETRLREGWRPMTDEQALDLPYGSPPGYHPLYWKVRRQTYNALVRLLARRGPAPRAGPAADLGAGTGWLAHRLARAGYRVLAVEASVDVAFGLQAAQVYRAQVLDRLLPVQGDLERPPLARGSTSLIILNASLHYARDLDETLRRTAAALRPRGCLVVLDTPIARRPRPGKGIGDRHLGRRELSQALHSAGLSPHWVRVARPGRWWWHQTRAWIGGDALFAFPIVWARLT